MHRLPRKKLIWIGLALFAVGGAVILLCTDLGRAAMEYGWIRIRGGYSVAERIEMHGADVSDRVAPLFARAGVGYPPRHLALVAFKDSRRLEVYARDTDSEVWRRVTQYPIRGMSGRLGPKLREGDRQVPEGLYRAEFLNPNSRFHLSIRLDYPNAFDRERGIADGRDRLGSDIMIHGSSVSIGCLAMGNEAAEDLFILAALAGTQNVRILISPTDFRQPGAVADVAGPVWTTGLYARITHALTSYPAAR